MTKKGKKMSFRAGMVEIAALTAIMGDITGSAKRIGIKKDREEICDEKHKKSDEK